MSVSRLSGHTFASGPSSKRLITRHSTHMTPYLPTPVRINKRMGTSSKGRQAASLLMHLPLLSIHFYYTTSSFFDTQTFLFHSMLFSHHPSIPFIPLNLTSLTSDPIIFFTNQLTLIFSRCPNHLNTLISARPANYLVIAVLLRTYYRSVKLIVKHVRG